MTAGPPPTGPIDPSGRVLGDRWRIDRHLANGGQASVYIATEVRRTSADGTSPPVYAVRGDEGTFVVKLTELPNGTAELEFHETSQHRHLVAFRDAGDLPASDPLGDLIPNRTSLVSPIHWLVMPRATGSLGDKIHESGVTASEPLPPDACEQLWTQLVSALDYLNEQRRVHGDIKPANVLEYPVKSGTDWRLSDFGLMVDVDSHLTHAPARGSTPAYASPSVRADRVVRPRDDRYSAALTVHIAAVGRLPEIDAQGHQHVSPRIPVPLRGPLQRAIDLDPEPSDYDQVTQPLSEPAGRAEPTPAPARRSPRRVTAAVAAGALVALLGVGAFWWSGRDGGDGAGTDGSTTTAASDSTTVEATGTGSTVDVKSGSGSGGDRDDTLVFVRRSRGASTVIEATDTGADQQPLPLDATDPTEPSINEAGDLAFITDVEGQRAIAIGSLGSSSARTFQVDGGAADPAISPDGATVAYTTEANGNRDVALLDLTTGATRVLAGGYADESAPSWSPDGTEVALVLAGSGGDTILAVDAASGDQRPLTEASGSKDSPTWSPDGSDVAFVGEVGGSTDLLTVSADGAGTPKITVTTDDDELAATWCRSGIVTAAARTGLVLVDPVGKTQQPVTNTGGDLEPACSP